MSNVLRISLSSFSCYPSTQQTGLRRGRALARRKPSRREQVCARRKALKSLSLFGACAFLRMRKRRKQGKNKRNFNDFNNLRLRMRKRAQAAQAPHATS